MPTSADVQYRFAIATVKSESRVMLGGCEPLGLNDNARPLVGAVPELATSGSPKLRAVAMQLLSMLSTSFAASGAVGTLSMGQSVMALLKDPAHNLVVGAVSLVPSLAAPDRAAALPFVARLLYSTRTPAEAEAQCDVVLQWPSPVSLALGVL